MGILKNVVASVLCLHNYDSSLSLTNRWAEKIPRRYGWSTDSVLGFQLIAWIKPEVIDWCDNKAGIVFILTESEDGDCWSK